MPCAKGMRGCHRLCAHRERVQGYYLEREAQDERAEAASNGYETELAAYFDPHDGQERRWLFKDWLIATANPEDEEAAA